MDDIVILNVGGTTYVTTKTTLLIKGSYFEKRLCGQMLPGVTVNDGIFIDRDGALFASILNYLRNLDNYEPPNDPKLLLDLLNEAQFFGLDGLIEKIKARIPPAKKGFVITINLKNSAAESLTFGWIPQELADELNPDLIGKITTNAVATYNLRWTTRGKSAWIISRTEENYRVISKEEYVGHTTLSFVDRYSNDPLYDTLRRKLYGTNSP
jgi:BTB/POZ domain